jgi:hypothetical protein
MEKLNQFLFLKPFLKMISEGNFFKTVFVWFLRILAILTVLGLLGISYQLWHGLVQGFQLKLMFLFLIMQIIILALCYLIITILLSRSEDIENMPKANDYLVMPIFVIVAKMVGEIFVSFYSLMGLLAGISIWMVGFIPPMIPGLGMIARSGGGVIGGIMAIIMGPIIGFIMLSIFYFVGEQISVWIDISRNTKKK